MTFVGYDDRLDFELPDFTRIAWVSDRAHAVWSERMRRIAQAWLRVEMVSVVAGVRACHLTRLTDDALVAASTDGASQGLSVLPLRREGIADGYRACPVAPGAGARDALLVVVGRPGDAARFREAWSAHDHDEMGRMLGYPTCCRDFFAEVWVRGRCVDTTWPMALAGRSREERRVLRVGGAAEANVLWRWMGLRLVPHLPCRFDCPPTVELGRQLAAVAEGHGLGEQFDLLREVLDWPVAWSALHGIAEVKTPVCKVIARTDATAGRYTVERDGAHYPDEGAEGLGFPYRTRGPAAPSTPVTFRRRSHTPTSVAEPAQRRAARYRDNGFRSGEDMRRLHQPVIAAALDHLGPDDGDIADLGCGNGALLHAILTRCPGQVRGYGVEIDAAKVERGRAMWAEDPDDVGITLMAADLFDVDAWAMGRQHRLVLLSAQRIAGLPDADAPAFVAKLRRCARDLLLYAYPDASHQRFAQALRAFTASPPKLGASLALVPLRPGPGPASS